MIDSGPGGSADPVIELPAAVKIAALFVLGLLIYLLPWLSVQVVLLGVAVLILLMCRIRPRVLLRSLGGLALIAVTVFAVTALTDSPVRAVLNTLRLSTLWLFALAVTASTRFSELLECFERWLQPLRHLGLRPDRMSLALALTIRFVPEIRARYGRIREAQYARGLQSHPLAIVIPLLVQTLNDAEEISAAIDARCYDTAADH